MGRIRNETEAKRPAGKTFGGSRKGAFGCVSGGLVVLKKRRAYMLQLPPLPQLPHEEPEPAGEGRGFFGSTTNPM